MDELSDSFLQTYVPVCLPPYPPIHLPTSEIHRDTIRRVYTGTRWCVHTYFRARAADGHIMRENVKRQQLARPPAGRLVPGGRQLPDGKTPALPFLLDRPGPVSRVAQEEPTPVSLFLLSLPLSASFSFAFSFLPFLIFFLALRPSRWPRTKGVLYAGDGRHHLVVATGSPRRLLARRPHAGAVPCHVVSCQAEP